MVIGMLMNMQGGMLNTIIRMLKKVYTMRPEFAKSNDNTHKIESFDKLTRIN